MSCSAGTAYTPNLLLLKCHAAEFSLTVQSGLADKVVKPSRKLRKERKNRSKKVSLYHLKNIVGDGADVPGSGSSQDEGRRRRQEEVERELGIFSILRDWLGFSLRIRCVNVSALHRSARMDLGVEGMWLDVGEPERGGSGDGNTVWAMWR